MPLSFQNWAILGIIVKHGEPIAQNPFSSPKIFQKWNSHVEMFSFSQAQTSLGNLFASLKRYFTGHSCLVFLDNGSLSQNTVARSVISRRKVNRFQGLLIFYPWSIRHNGNKKNKGQESFTKEHCLLHLLCPQMSTSAVFLPLYVTSMPIVRTTQALTFVLVTLDLLEMGKHAQVIRLHHLYLSLFLCFNFRV